MENTGQSGPSSPEDQSVPSKGTIASRLAYLSKGMGYNEGSRTMNFHRLFVRCGSTLLNLFEP